MSPELYNRLRFYFYPFYIMICLLCFWNSGNFFSGSLETINYINWRYSGICCSQNLNIYMLWRLRGFLFWNGQGDLHESFVADNFFALLVFRHWINLFLDQLFLGVEENIKHSAGLIISYVSQRDF